MYKEQNVEEKRVLFDDELNFDAVCSHSHHLYTAKEVTVKKNGIGLSGKTDWSYNYPINNAKVTHMNIHDGSMYISVAGENGGLFSLFKHSYGQWEKILPPGVHAFAFVDNNIVYTKPQEHTIHITQDGRDEVPGMKYLLVQSGPWVTEMAPSEQVSLDSLLVYM